MLIFWSTASYPSDLNDKTAGHWWGHPFNDLNVSVSFFSDIDKWDFLFYYSCKCQDPSLDLGVRRPHLHAFGHSWILRPNYRDYVTAYQHLIIRFQTGIFYFKQIKMHPNLLDWGLSVCRLKYLQVNFMMSMICLEIILEREIGHQSILVELGWWGHRGSLYHTLYLCMCLKPSTIRTF